MNNCSWCRSIDLTDGYFLFPSVVIDVDDIGDDHGHVVRAAALERQLDHPVRALLRVRDAQRLRDRLHADRTGQAVGAQQVAVPRAGLADRQARFHLVAGQRVQQQRALRVVGRL